MEKSAIKILKEIKNDDGYKKLSDGNDPVYYLVDTQDENKIYLFSTQKQIETFTDSKGAVVKQSNISTHKDTGTLSKKRWLIFSKKCVGGEKLFRFKWKNKKATKEQEGIQQDC